MAKQLDEFEFRKSNRGKRIYPWDQWLNGEIWQLQQGVDFEITMKQMRTAAHLAAGRRDLRVQGSADGNTLIIQAVKTEVNDD